MTWKFHCWVYTQEKCKHTSIQQLEHQLFIAALLIGAKTSIKTKRPPTGEWINKMGYIPIQWNVIEPQKGMNYWSMLQSGGNLKPLCQMKEARHKHQALHDFMQTVVWNRQIYTACCWEGRWGNEEWVWGLLLGWWKSNIRWLQNSEYI